MVINNRAMNPGPKSELKKRGRKPKPAGGAGQKKGRLEESEDQEREEGLDEFE